MKNPYLETSDFGWQIDPMALRISLNELRDRFNLPIYSVENGLGAAEDNGADTIGKGCTLHAAGREDDEFLRGGPEGEDLLPGA